MRHRSEETEVVEAPAHERPEGAPARPPPPRIKLPMFNVPPNLREEATNGVAAERSERVRNLLGRTAAADGIKAYQKHYQELLWLEEIQLIRDLHDFDLRDDEATVLTQRGRQYGLGCAVSLRIAHRSSRAT